MHLSGISVVILSLPTAMTAFSIARIPHLHLAC